MLNDICINCPKDATISNNNCVCGSGLIYNSIEGKCLTCAKYAFKITSMQFCYCPENTLPDKGVCKCLNINKTPTTLNTVTKICLPCPENCDLCSYNVILNKSFCESTIDDS